MARRRFVIHTLFSLLLILARIAAHPLFPERGRQLEMTSLLEKTVMNHVRQFFSVRITQNGQPDTAIDEHGGFSVASSVGVAVSATFTLAVIVSLSYTGYYRHAKLQLHRQFLERLGPPASQAQDQQAENSSQAASPAIHRRTRTAPDTYGLTVLISPPPQRSPDIYSTLQAEQPKPPVTSLEAKTKAAEENKVLGRREDIIPLGRQFGHAARDGQMLAILRPAF